MKSLIVLLFSLMISTAWAVPVDNECYLKLTNNYERDSAHFYRVVDAEDRDYGNDLQGYAFFIVRDTLEGIGCNRSSINFGKGPRGKASYI